MGKLRRLMNKDEINKVNRESYHRNSLKTNESRRRKFSEFSLEEKISHNKRVQNWRQRNSDKAKDIQRKSLYNLSKSDLMEIFLSQEGRCPVCQKELDFYGRQVHIDHDHSCCNTIRSCGRCVRGFMCSGHNKGLGQFDDNPAYLRNAADYLEKFIWK